MSTRFARPILKPRAISKSDTHRYAVIRAYRFVAPKRAEVRYDTLRGARSPPYRGAPRTGLVASHGRSPDCISHTSCTPLTSRVAAILRSQSSVSPALKRVQRAFILFFSVSPSAGQRG